MPMYKIYSLLFLFVLSSAISFFFESWNPIVAQTKESIGARYALVVGISHYQDPEIPDLTTAHRDAELFASYLRNQLNVRIEDENLLLITNEQATAARVATALDWLFENRRPNDTVILYFAGYGMERNQTTIPASKLYFYDTPLGMNQVGSFDLFFQFQSFIKSRKSAFQLFANFYPLVVSSELRNDSIPFLGIDKLEKPFKNSIYLNTIHEKTFHLSFKELSDAKLSMNDLVLDGLLGLADKNMDRVVTLKELDSYLKQQTIIEEYWPGLLFVACSPKMKLLNVIQAKNATKLKTASTYLPSMLQFEISSKENVVLQKVSDKNRLLFQDFIVAIKLGHLLEPKDRNAANLADALLAQQEFASIYTDIRRKLSAAFQDESQQALNAYLNSDSRELIKRQKGSELYKLYPEYLKRALDLLGKQHFMGPILKAKQLYFEGLIKRFEGQRSKDFSLIEAALELQLHARSFEHEAAFIYNEIAINFRILGKKVEAQKNFEFAIENAPNWSIPFSNYAQLYIEDDLSKALRIAKHAIRLSPRNSYAYNVEALVYLKSKDYIRAEASFLQAIKLDPCYIDAFYNVACIKSLKQDYKAAKIYLESAINCGFSDIDFAREDPDLELFRNQVEWNELLGSVLLKDKK